MDKNEVTAFFDALAPVWDTDLEHNDEVIDAILDIAGINNGIHVLDVACGTGVLIEDYFKRGAASVVGVDISSEMIKIASEKFPSAEFICADAENYSFDRKFGAIVIYNAFPHFVTPSALFSNLSSALCEGGRLTVAHGMSMEKLQRCHSGSAFRVSRPLPEKEVLADMISDYLTVDTMISDDNMYVVSAYKN